MHNKNYFIHCLRQINPLYIQLDKLSQYNHLIMTKPMLHGHEWPPPNDRHLKSMTVFPPQPFYYIITIIYTGT